MRIILMRHGRPEFDLPALARSRVVPRDLRDIKCRYDAAALDFSLPASQQAMVIARRCHKILCSDLQRSLDSTRALGLSAQASADALYREADLPHGDKLRPRLSLYTWLLIYRGLWFTGYDRNGESFERFKTRVAEATESLIQSVRAHHSVLLVGHGWLNHFIGRSLLRRGWQGPRTPGRHYWEFGEYTL